MNPFEKIKIYCKTYFAERSRIQLYELVEEEAKVLSGDAPEGTRPFDVIIQPDGGANTSEIVRPGEDIIDEPALRQEIGDINANVLQNKAIRTIEEISRLDIETRDALEFRQDLRDKQNKLLDNTPDFYFALSEARINLFIFMAVALGEIGFGTYLFSDILGLDPTSLVRESIRHPVSAIFTFFLATGFFISSLLIAEKALDSKFKVRWITGLVLMAFLTAQLRAAQTASTGETELSPMLLTLIFMFLGLALPLAAAFFYVNWKEARNITGRTDSMSKRLREEEARIDDRLREVDQNRERAEDKLDNFTELYIGPYQKAKEQRERSMAEWEQQRRRTEGYLAEVKLAYLFWQGWRQRREVISREVKKLLQITGVLFLALAVSLGSNRAANAETPFNVVALCDRSTSASDYSCTPEAIESLGRLWIKKADEATSGTFELFLIDQGFDTTVLLFSTEYPDHFPGPVSAHRKKWKNEFLRELAAKLKELPSRTGSAIMEAVYRCSIRMPDIGETVIYVLSDMRQVNGVFNFERRVPSVNEFLLWLKREAIEPQFKEQDSIVVCGIHPYTPDNTSRMTTRNYNQLLRLWKGVFEQWGVKASFSEACDFNITKEE